MKKIQRNRGCAIRKANGMRIVMYYDEPGVYYNGVGEQVTEEVAQQAGFDVGALAKERVKHERRRNFERTLAVGDDETVEVSLRATSGKTLQIVKGTQPRTYQVTDARGKTVVVNTALTKREAEITFKAMTGKPYVWPAKAAAPEAVAENAPREKKKKKKKKKSGAKGLL